MPTISEGEAAFRHSVPDAEAPFKLLPVDDLRRRALRTMDRFDHLDPGRGLLEGAAAHRALECHRTFGDARLSCRHGDLTFGRQGCNAARVSLVRSIVFGIGERHGGGSGDGFLGAFRTARGHFDPFVVIRFEDFPGPRFLRRRGRGRE